MSAEERALGGFAAAGQYLAATGVGGIVDLLRRGREMRLGVKGLKRLAKPHAGVVYHEKKNYP
ncbi:hypothetical protein AGE09_23380 [Salmonella enterica subsp. enterica serovar Kentucky]|nr:hypothetical protein AGE09_23380 [Salmonella enterica subsp. enterica serovar Kentucky]